MKHILLVLALVSAMFTHGQETSAIYQRAKISFNQDADLERLEVLDIPVDHGIHKRNHYLISEYSKNELDIIRANGFQVEVLVPDAKVLFLEQNRTAGKTQRNTSNCINVASPDTYPTPSNFNQGSMGGYLTYQEVLDELDDMRDLYPNLITEKSPISDFETEGQSNTNTTPSIGENPIFWVRISDNPENDEDEAEILYTSIHHAREPMSLMQNIYYMWYLLENYETDPEIRAIVDNTELYFVPVVNPDGYLYNEFTDPNGGGFWRKNRKNGSGVDNNRNYNYFINGDSNNGVWGGPGSSGDSSSPTYRGTEPFSEIENQAIKWFVEQHEFVIALNSHTSGELLYYPFAYNGSATPDEATFVAMAGELTSRNNYFPLRDCCFSGDSDDFMYGTVNTHESILAFTPEIGTAFWMPPNEIEETCEEMMYQNITAAQMATSYGALTTNPDIFIGTPATVTIDFDLRNLGVSDDGDFTVSLLPISSNITDAGTAETLNNMDFLETDDGSITYTLDSDIMPGDEIQFELIVSNGMYDNAFPVTQIYGETQQEFFADGTSTTDGFSTNEWDITSSTFNSAPSAITDSDGGNYSNNEDKAIATSDPIDLSTALGASASFFTRWDIEEGFDYVQFEISTDDGATWEPQCGKLTTRGSAQQAEDQPIYDGILTQWTKEEINLNDYLGETIIARFRLVSDNGTTRDGFYFDDLEFAIIPDPSLSVEDTAFAKAFSTYPNPVSDALHIQTTFTNYSATIYNLQGQRIIQYEDLNGNYRIDYSAFTTGMYFVQLAAQGKTTTIKILKK